MTICNENKFIIDSFYVQMTLIPPPLLNRITKKEVICMGYQGYQQQGNNYGNCGGGSGGGAGVSTFALIVVLFILLVIVGATFVY